MDERFEDPCTFPHVGRHFVVDDAARTGRYLVVRWVEFAQSGRSHEVVGESTSEHSAWEIAKALAR